MIRIKKFILISFIFTVVNVFGQENRIKYYETVKPKYLDPVYGMQSMVGQRVVSLTFRPICGRDRSLKIVPKMAVEMPALAGDQVTFSLKPNMTWHDGNPITIKDVHESLIMFGHDEEFFAPNFLNPYDQYTLQGRQLIARVRSGHSYSPYHFTIPFVPRHKFPAGVVEKSSEFVMLKPIGNGPFYIEENNSTNKIIFKRFDDYIKVRQQHTNIKEIELFVEVSRSQWATRMRGGSVDILPTVPTAQIADLNDLTGVVLEEYANYSLEMIGFNFQNDLLKELFVRKAIYHAYDRETTIQSALSGNGSISTGPYPSGSKYYWSALPAYEYNPEKAHEILGRHCKKGSDGIYTYQGKRLSFRLAGSSGNFLYTSEAQTFVSKMKEVGIEIKTPNQYDPGNLVAHLNNKDFDLIWLKLTYLSSETNISPNYTSTGSDNYWSYSNTRVDAKLQALELADDRYLRLNLGYNVHKEIHDDPPCLFLWTEKLYTAFNSKILNFKAHPVEYFYLVEEWELKE